MKTKDLVVGQEYVFGGAYNKQRGVLLSLDTKWVSRVQLRHRGYANNHGFRLAVKEAGERGGLAFAVRRRYDPEAWTPVVVQPNAIFATAEAYEATKVAREAEYQAQLERQYAEQQRQHGYRRWVQHVVWVQNYWFNVQLKNLGLDPVSFDYYTGRVSIKHQQLVTLITKAAS